MFEITTIIILRIIIIVVIALFLFSLFFHLYFSYVCMVPFLLRFFMRDGSSKSPRTHARRIDPKSRFYGVSQIHRMAFREITRKENPTNVTSRYVPSCWMWTFASVEERTIPLAVRLSRYFFVRARHFMSLFFVSSHPDAQRCVLYVARNWTRATPQAGAALTGMTRRQNPCCFVRSSSSRSRPAANCHRVAG